MKSHLLLLPSLLAVLTLSSCVSNVSDTAPHSNLVGTTWKLKQDAYIIEYYDSRGNFYIIPCLPKFYGYIPGEGELYREENVGRKDNKIRIVGGLRSGELFKVAQVTEVRSFEMGTSFDPMIIPLKSNRWTGVKKLNAAHFYDGYPYGKFHDKGILNPDYVVRIK